MVCGREKSQQVVPRGNPTDLQEGELLDGVVGYASAEQLQQPIETYSCHSWIVGLRYALHG
jgi:hypothetical protein